MKLNKRLIDLLKAYDNKDFNILNINQQKQIILSTISELCHQQNLPEIPVRFVNEGLDDYGTFNSIFGNININLDILLEEENSSYKILDVIIHEFHHYEQFLHGNKKIQYSVNNPLSQNNKYYSHQPHEKDAYNYTFNYLKQIFKELNLEGLDTYIKKEQNTYNTMKQKVSKLEYPWLESIIKKLQQKDEKATKLIKKYAPEIYPDETCISTLTRIQQINALGEPIELNLNIEQSTNYLDVLIAQTDNPLTTKESLLDATFKNSITLKIKDNKAIIFLNDFLPPPENIKTQIELAQTLVHKYNLDNKKKIEDMIICPESTGINNKDLEKILKELVLDKDSKIKLDNSVDNALINTINSLVNEKFIKNLLTINSSSEIKINKALLSLDVLETLIKKENINNKLNTLDKNQIALKIEQYLKLNPNNTDIIDILKKCNLIKSTNTTTDNIDTLIQQNTSINNLEHDKENLDKGEER